MKSDIMLPLFPLNVVLLPGTLLPLHIFEERYKEMIGECLSEMREFGIVYLNDEKITRIGCSAQIVELLKRYENGEMDIITLGTDRFFIKALDETRSYYRAKIIPFEDDPVEETEGLKKLVQSGIQLLKELNSITGGDWDKAPFAEESDMRKVSFLISGYDGFTSMEKQNFLEMTSTRKRVEEAVEALKKALLRARLNLKIQHIVKGNGDAKKTMMRYYMEESQRA